MSRKSSTNLLKGARVYLSGPMDFVASRAMEKKNGWRNRVGQLFRHYGATVFDPWSKPVVRGMWEYGKEDEKSADARKKWTFRPGEAGAKRRGECAKAFWETLHIDLRMVDISDIVIAYCPTNIYSVGTPHEVVQARQQHKPVLFVSPPVVHSSFDTLEAHLQTRGDVRGGNLIRRVEAETPVKPNPEGIPSLWYMPLINTESFFDGFGFNVPALRKRFGWTALGPLDKHEAGNPPRRPLIPYLQKLARGVFPMRWNAAAEKFEQDDDWLILSALD